MIHMPCILAASGDGSGIIPIVVMAIFIIFLTIVKRIRQSSEQTGSQRPQPPPPPPQSMDEPRIPPVRMPPPRVQSQVQGLPDWMRPAAPRPPAQAPAAPTAQRQRPPGFPARTPAPVARAPLPQANDSGDLAEEVDREMLAQQERRRHQDEDRGRRLAAIHLAKSPQLGEVSQLHAASITPGTVRPAAADQAGQPALLLDLHDPQQLRAAIILHEIFLPPKATRGAQELWER